MKVYKLTDENHQTYNGMQWGEGVEHELPRIKAPMLCSPDLIHFYEHLNLGLLLNPLQGEFASPVIWEAKTDTIFRAWHKSGGFRCKTIKIIPWPDWYAHEPTRKLVCVQFAVLCAEAVLPQYEKAHPNGNRPRQAVEAAKAWLSNPTYKNKSHARVCAEGASDTALGLTWPGSFRHRTRNVANVAYYSAAAVNELPISCAESSAEAAFLSADCLVKIDFWGLADKAVALVTGEDNARKKTD